MVVLLLDKGKPVYFANTVIVLELTVGDLCAKISLDLAVNEIFLVPLFNPFHLSLEALQEVIIKHVLPSDIVNLVIDQAIDVLVHLRWNELIMGH